MVGSVGRVFVAVGLSDLARHDLAAYLSDHLPSLPGTVVPPENWHITLRFLGSINDVEFDLLLRELDDAELGPAFTMRLAGLGAFPKPAKATVLWLGMSSGAEELTELAERTRDAVERAGFGAEDRPFVPHLTLSRIRPARDVWSVLESVPEPPIRVEVNQVGIYRSHLGAAGARYELLEAIPLGAWR